MSNALKYIVLTVILLATPVAFFFMNFKIRGLGYLGIEPREDGYLNGTGTYSDDLPVVQGQKAISIATFNLGPLDRDKLNKRHVVGHLASVIRRFDVVAIQDIRAANQNLLVAFVEQVNAEGAHYDFAVSPSVRRDNVQQYGAFVFNRATIQIDRSTVYNVQDRAGRIRREPLVASFRVRGPKPDEAFTFTLINVHTDQNQVVAELGLLDDVFRAVRDDGRGEDDVIMLGDLGADNEHLDELGQLPAITWAIADKPTTTRGLPRDNILFNRRATAEFTGRAGVTDLMQEFRLSKQEAVEVSEHFPVWANFNVLEGEHFGPMAKASENSTR